MSEQEGSGTLATGLSFGDEASGRIVLRGFDLAELAQEHSYEEVVVLLWSGLIADTLTAEALAAGRIRVFGVLKGLENGLKGRSTAEAMRALIGALPSQSDQPALDLVAGVGVAAAAAVRSSTGAAWVAPDLKHGHAADLLAMVGGQPVDARKARAFERYCILMIDHGISASTYAARIAASTLAPLPAAAAAALSVLQGVRHGGAPALVLDQLDAVGRPEQARAYVQEARASGRRIVGFGSRAYAGRDVRADLMRAEWRSINGAKGQRAEAEAMEASLTAALAERQAARGLKPNVEYYAALLLEAVGLNRDAFTPMFAAARSAGWAAHYREQAQDRRMIRPVSHYIGEPLSAGK